MSCDWPALTDAWATWHPYKHPAISVVHFVTPAFVVRDCSSLQVKCECALRPCFGLSCGTKNFHQFRPLQYLKVGAQAPLNKRGRPTKVRWRSVVDEKLSGYVRSPVCNKYAVVLKPRVKLTAKLSFRTSTRSRYSTGDNTLSFRWAPDLYLFLNDRSHSLSRCVIHWRCWNVSFLYTVLSHLLQDI